MSRTILSAALLGLALASATGARADSPAGTRRAAWQSCLNDAFALRAALSGRVLAADTALRECRDRESAYLDALAASPLVDDADVARVRPALVARARFQLIGTARSRQL